jgi:glucose/mannose-6-phosphate isomerase
MAIGDNWNQCLIIQFILSRNMPEKVDYLALLRAYDASDMMGQVRSLPDQLEEAISKDFKFEGEFQDVYVCGMGGSAIGGDILCDYAADKSDVPISVIRGVDLPRSVRAGSLAIMISYSGNTREVLSLYRQASERGCRIIGITSGGELGELCEKEGYPIIYVPAGIQPRAALGHLLGSAALVLQSAGIAPARDEIEGMIPRLKELRDSLVPEVEGNMAMSIAKQLLSTIPVIYSPRRIRSSAIRWQTQMNENSKMIAFSGEVPEMNHNLIVGWIEGDHDCPCRPVFIKNSSIDDTVNEIMGATIESFEENGIGVIMAEVDGMSDLEGNLMSIIIGDFVSVYLALLRGVDPTPVKAIIALKAKLSRIFG